PVLIQIDKEGHKEVMAADAKNQVYLVDSLGNIRWKTRLPGAPVGLPRAVFAPKADSAFFLVCTPARICLLMPDGNFAPGYPMPLPARAMAAITPAEPKKNPDNRFLVPLADRRIWSFKPDGKPPHVAMNPGIREDIVYPVNSVEYAGKDFYFIRGKNGHLMITDARGKTLVHTPKTVALSGLSDLYINRTNRKGSFLTTDPSGKVLYINLSGKTAEVTFNLFSPAHRFFYVDLNQDGAFEFIFYDQNKLYYYNRFYKLIYSYVFTRELSIPPFLIELPGGKYRIGAVSGTADELYLFGDQGMIPLEPGISGNTFFDIGSPDGTRRMLLVTATGKYLKCYRLPKQ
ncbi:MAG TPA: hypothetical protein VMC08_04785, partial [Bacteroidales bacterium]|nr:hypothetical protein [Bacteroidales bacterium]